LSDILSVRVSEKKVVPTIRSEYRNTTYLYPVNLANPCLCRQQAGCHPVPKKAAEINRQPDTQHVLYAWGVTV